MASDNTPEIPISGEERVIHCGAMGVVTWEVSDLMWKHIQGLSPTDRERVLDIMAKRLHENCHDICAHVAAFMATRQDSTMIEGDTFPSSWLHE